MSLLVFVCGCSTIYNPATQRREIYFIDEKTEVSMGQKLASQILGEKKIVDDEHVLSYVREIGEAVASVSDRRTLTYHFYILDDKNVNAFALPGGYIFVNKGLLDYADRNELAFVLGHEIGHVCARHSVKRLQASLGLNLILDITLRNPRYGDVRRAVDVASGVVSAGYSRQDEFLADSLGVTYSARAGFVPEAGITMIEKLRKENARSAFNFFSSHPPPEARIKNIRRKIEEICRDRSRPVRH